MSDDVDIFAGGQQLGRAVAGAVIYNKNVLAEAQDFVQHAVDVLGFIENGKRC